MGSSLSIKLAYDEYENPAPNSQVEEQWEIELDPSEFDLTLNNGKEDVFHFLWKSEDFMTLIKLYKTEDSILR